MTDNNNNNKRPRIDPIKSRIAYIGDNILTHTEACGQREEIAELMMETATKLVEIVERFKAGSYDIGRLIRALDFLNETKDTASQSIAFPCYKRGQDNPRPNPPRVTSSNY